MEKKKMRRRSQKVKKVRLKATAVKSLKRAKSLRNPKSLVLQVLRATRVNLKKKRVLKVNTMMMMGKKLISPRKRKIRKTRKIKKTKKTKKTRKKRRRKSH